MDLRRCKHWIFDLDGTLTIAAHDFDAIRDDLGIAPGRPILEALAQLPAAEAAARTARLDEVELEIARSARPQPGAAELLEGLARRGARLGIVTRNSRPNAIETLRASGLLPSFEAADVMGRDEAAPKPDPAGIRALLARWGAAPGDAVMVGDFRFDLTAARAAGIPTVYFDPTAAFPFAAEADVCVASLDGIADLSGSRIAGAASRDPRWFGDGLAFGCSRCGRCCTGTAGSVFVSDSEIDALAERLGLSPTAFRAEYTRRGGRGLVRLAESRGGDCVFFADGGCTLYEHRPRQCRTWPFWRANCISEESWETTSQVCPGIGRGPLHDRSAIDLLLAADGLPVGGAR